MLILLTALSSFSLAQADCPDRQYTCPNTGITVSYGTCWNWSSLSCEPCGGINCNVGLYDSWMSTNGKVQNSTLREITIPGAHDAGMGKISGCSTYANSQSTQTQNKSFAQMLNVGTRLFDLRPVINKNGNMYLGHYQWIGQDIDILLHTFTLRNEGCMGYSVDEMLEDVRAFLASHSHEVVYLNFSHFMDFQRYDSQNSDFDDLDLKKLEDKVISKLGRYLVMSNQSYLDTPIFQLTNNGSKAIVTFSKGAYNGSNGIYSVDPSYYDSYSETDDFNVMKNDQFKKMRDNASSYFVLSWTLTMTRNEVIGCALGGIGGPAGYPCVSIFDLAKAANNNLDQAVNYSVQTKMFPNVIYTDFMTDNQTVASLQMNGAR